MMQTSTIIVIALLLIVVLNVLTIVATLAAKALRSRKGEQEKQIRDLIEPALYEYLVLGEVSPILRQAKTKNPDILSAMIVKLMTALRGAEYEKMVSLAKDLGLAKRDFQRLRSQRRWQRAQAVENLGYYGGDQRTAPLSELLDDEDETVRAVAARALSRIGTREAAVALSRRLVSPSELTSLRMAENLERIGPLAVEPLLELIEREEDEARRAQVLAARILGNLRVYEARPALGRTIVQRWNTSLRAQAALSLGKIGDPEDVPVLLEAAQDDSWPVRSQAANALEMIGDTSAIPTLESLVEDREWWVRLNASRALVNMGAEGEKALTRVLEAPDRYARDRAAAVMENRGITRRMVTEMAGSDERAEGARNVVQKLIRNGTTRHLEYLARTLPKGDEQRELRELLAAERAESDES
ncbi:MAG: HEAT repeat domain-containing protein [Rubrobacteraceae bacterium]